MGLVKTVLQILLACLIPNLGGWIGALFTSTDDMSWYGKLVKPSFNPPVWLFLPAWSILYISIGYASYRVWDAGNGFNGTAKLPLIVYIIQLVLNWFYTPVLFGLESLLGGFIVILILYVFAVATGVLFFRVDKIAGLIFIPYVAWLTFATILNYALYDLN